MADFDPKEFSKYLLSWAEIEAESKKAGNNIKEIVKFLKEQKTLQSEIVSLTKQLREVTSSVEELDRDDLGTRKDILKLDKEILKIKKIISKTEENQKIFANDKTKNGKRLNQELVRQLALSNQILGTLKEQREISKQIRNNFGVKGFSLLSEVFTKIGGKASLLAEPFDKAAKVSRQTVKDAIIENQKVKEKASIIEKIKNGQLSANKANLAGMEILSKGGKALYGNAAQAALKSGSATITGMGRQVSTMAAGFEGMAAGMSALGGAFARAGWIGALVGIGKFFIDAMFTADTRVTNIAKGLLITKHQARGVYEEIKSWKTETDLIYGYTKNLTEAYIDLIELSGFNLRPTKEQAELQVELTKNLGLSKEEALGIQQAFLANNVENGKGLDITRKQIVTFANQNKMIISSGKVLSDINKTSKLIQLNFKGNLENMVNTTLEAKKLGLTLDQVSKIGRSLLNFEQSLTAEMEAELITGRELNLEQARYYALTNNIAGLVGEIAKNGITMESFASMNAIEQEKIAAAFGMQAEEMADMLYKRRIIDRQAKGYTDALRQQADELDRQNNTSEAIKKRNLALAIEEQIYTGKSLEEAERSVSAQEKFNIALERAQGIFADLVTDGILDSLSDVLLDIIMKLEDLGFGDREARLSIEKGNIMSTQKDLSASKTYKTKSGKDITSSEYIDNLQEVANADVDILGIRFPYFLYGNETFGSGFITDEMIDFAKGELSRLKTEKLSSGGLVKKGGLAEVDRGELYLGANSAQVLDEIKNLLKIQNEQLAALNNKNYTPIITMNGVALNEAQDLYMSRS